MTPLHNHTILFDAECPICKLYTKAIVNNGIMENAGRIAYQDITEETCPMVNRQRAVDEIALINNNTGEVSYGVESVFKILAAGLPILKPLLTFGPFVWLMKKFYAFFSYNRRLIIPTAHIVQKHALQPTFRLGYRVLYLLFTWAITAFVLTNYVHLMDGMLPQGPGYREYLICGGQIFFQGIVVTLLAKNKTWDYLGNMMTVSFGGALLLLPGLIAANYFDLSPIIYAVYFMAVAGIMLFEHIRRVKLLHLTWAVSASWVLYRLLVLLLIFLAN